VEFFGEFDETTEFVSEDGVRDKDSTKIEVDRGYKDLGFDGKV
jgi:hypothetical protein